MSQLSETVQSGFTKCFEDFRNRVHRMADQLTPEQFWTRPFDFGNSFGNLVQHIDGNLSYYIGTQIGQTGYVRDRELEFAPVQSSDKSAALHSLDATVQMVIDTISKQSDDHWILPYSATGVTDVDNRFEMVLRAAAHFHHHIGQMTYIVKQWNLVNQ